MEDWSYISYRPPLFDGSNYYVWKSMMIPYIKGLDYSLWRRCEIGPYVPTKKGEDGTPIPKSFEEYDDADCVQLSKNDKAMSILYRAVPCDVISLTHCQSAHQIWKLLEATYEEKAKETEISNQLREFELFAMKPDENVEAMYHRFLCLIDYLKLLGKDLDLTLFEINRKFLRALPREKWKPTVTAIRACNDLSTLSTEDICCLLLEEEFVLNQDKSKGKRPSKSLAIASRSKNDEEKDADELLDDEEFAMLVEEFLRYLKFKKWKKDRNTGQERRCFECNKPGHIRANCPKLKEREEKRYSSKKKALKVTWKGSSSGRSYEEDNHG